MLNLTPPASPNESTRVSKISHTVDIDFEYRRPKQIGDFGLTGTPSNFSSIRSYRFYNSSLQKSDSDFKFLEVPLRCLGGVNHLVIAMLNGLIP
ncbi:hypothetical protein L1987_13035 [Smallanthus sonchifolius]|uniref:Uncharacterized protein n=1 Tax=Smallanthus sonchifolius TaxID=185202 RepID=A0ACB9JFY9_9ASTR|nr:hypothetical protein L1987_13035 [Smallanthus sonchifolius]